jgi:hypothetical protein
MKNQYLRSCFLYLAIFPEDYRINVSVLIELWIAEGLIPNAPKHEHKETARKYVAELAQRNLVQITCRSRAHGWLEEIRIHDMLRDWCIEEAIQDGFLNIIDKTSGHVVFHLLSHTSTLYFSSTRTSYVSFSKRIISLIPLVKFKVITDLSLYKVSSIQCSNFD